MADLGAEHITPQELISATNISQARARQLCSWGNGIDNTPVEARGEQKSLLVERSFPERSLDTPLKLEVALLMLGELLCGRVENDFNKYGRIPGTLVVLRRIGYSSINSKRVRFPRQVIDALHRTRNLNKQTGNKRG